MSIDSRTLAPGDLFVAIRGERFDGHAFVGAAMAAGAWAPLLRATAAVARRPPGRRDAVVIRVEETRRRAAGAGAPRAARVGQPMVVAITGSAGKTTTKEVAAAFLGAVSWCFATGGNLNNHIGLPLSLLELRARPEVAVVELGMNHAGEIRTLVAIAEPDVRVWTNVARGALGVLRVARRHRRREGRDPRGGRPGRRCSWRTRTTRWSWRARRRFRGAGS